MERFKEGLRKNEIILVDTTLRDGEQTAGIVFSNREKVRIGKMLDRIGVHQIEAGIPVMGGDEKEAIRTLTSSGLKASIMAWNRASVKDIAESIDCGVDAVAISISSSDIHLKYKLQITREQVLKNIRESVEFAKSHGLYVSVNAEDASRSDFGFLVDFALTAKKAGADRLRYCDTVGILEPFKTREVVARLFKEIDMPIEMHTHNDFGMATANSLAGLKAGARLIGVTVNGLGERAGNAVLAEIVMSLKYLFNTDLGLKTEEFRELSEYVALAAGRPLPACKPIVGSNMFSHESGIHADGVMKNPATYEVFRPEEVGLERQIVLGKHSGSKAILLKFKEYNLDISLEEAVEVLPLVRGATVDLKRSLFDKELIYLYEDYLKEKKQKTSLGS